MNHSNRKVIETEYFVPGALQEKKYTGVDCSCPISNAACKKEGYDILCSGTYFITQSFYTFS